MKLETLLSHLCESMFSKQFFLVLIFRLTEGAETERNAITHLTKISSKAREGRCLVSSGTYMALSQGK